MGIEYKNLRLFCSNDSQTLTLRSLSIQITTHQLRLSREYYCQKTQCCLTEYFSPAFSQEQLLREPFRQAYLKTSSPQEQPPPGSQATLSSLRIPRQRLQSHPREKPLQLLLHRHQHSRDSSPHVTPITAYSEAIIALLLSTSLTDLR